MLPNSVKEFLFKKSFGRIMKRLGDSNYSPSITSTSTFVDLVNCYFLTSFSPVNWTFAEILQEAKENYSIEPSIGDEYKVNTLISIIASCSGKALSSPRAKDNLKRLKDILLVAAVKGRLGV